jgi:glutaminyl-tRNA synthetase
MYDYAHPISDAIEQVTHSLCTLEFEDHRPLYDWYLAELGMYRPQQIEFARLNLDYVALSKRKLIELVEGGHVDGWDDPRLPTLRGLKRRGLTPESIRAFCDHIGISKYNSVHELHLLEHFVRQDLEKKAIRALAVLKPLKMVIENWPAGQVDRLEASNHPDDPGYGTREVPFAGELFIEQDDFMESPPKDFFRLAPGREVRLRYAYFVKCTGVVKDADGRVVEVRCTYDPATRGGNAPDGRKVKATLHWVSAQHALDAEVRVYGTLFRNAEIGEDWKSELNPESLVVLRGCKLEPGLGAAKAGVPYQFERLGFFCVDSRTAGVWNRTVSLKDSYRKGKK